MLGCDIISSVQLNRGIRSVYHRGRKDHNAVADPGFPIGGRGPCRGCGLPRQLHFENFVCQNERIWTRRGACAGYAP